MQYVVGKPAVLNKDLLYKRIQDIIDSKVYSNDGPYCRALEEYFCSLYNCRYAIAVNNATSALEACLAYYKQRVPHGNVIVPSFTFAATVNSVVNMGYEPLFCDIGEDYCFDLNSFKDRSYSSVGAIPTSLFGNLVDHVALSSYQGFQIFDSAQALNVCDEDTVSYVGNFGDCEIISFHPTKICGAFEAGIISTTNKDIYEFLLEYRNFGFKVNSKSLQGELNSVGRNIKLNEVSAAGVLTQLEVIEDIQAHYYANYLSYKAKLPEWIKLSQPNVYFSNFSYIICRVHEAIRGSLIQYLYSKDIFARTYFTPVHRTKAYEKYNHIVLPNTERIAKQVLALPTGLTIEAEDIDYICQTIKEFVQ